MSYSLGLWCEYPLHATSKDPEPLRVAKSYFARLIAFIAKNNIRRLVFRLQCPEPPRRLGPPPLNAGPTLPNPSLFIPWMPHNPTPCPGSLRRNHWQKSMIWLLPYQDKWSGYSTLKHYQEPDFNPASGTSFWNHLAIADYMAAVPLVEYFNTTLTSKKVTGIVIETENTTLSGSEEQRLATLFSQLTDRTPLKYGATGGPQVSEPCASTIPAWRPSAKCSMFFPQWYWIGANESYKYGSNPTLLSKIEQCVANKSSFSKTNYNAMFSCEPQFFGNGEWSLEHFLEFLRGFRESRYGTTNFMIFQADFLDNPAHWMPSPKKKQSRWCLFF